MLADSNAIVKFDKVFDLKDVFRNVVLVDVGLTYNLGEEFHEVYSFFVNIFMRMRY